MCQRPADIWGVCMYVMCARATRMIVLVGSLLGCGLSGSRIQGLAAHTC